MPRDMTADSKAIISAALGYSNGSSYELTPNSPLVTMGYKLKKCVISMGIAAVLAILAPPQPNFFSKSMS